MSIDCRLVRASDLSEPREQPVSKALDNATPKRILDRCDLQGGRANNAYVFRDGQRGGRWCLYFINKETMQRHRFVLKRSNGRLPSPTPDGLDDALELALEKFIELRGKTDRGEAVRAMTIAEMVTRFLDKEEGRISNRPHEGITTARYRLLRNQAKHFLEFCCRKSGPGASKQVHLLRRSFLETYQRWREDTTDKNDKQGRKFPRPTTLNAEFSTIRRMFKEVPLRHGYITGDQMPEIPSAKVPKDKSLRRSSLSEEEWIQLEKTSRLYWTKGISRYSATGEPLGYKLITRGPSKGKESNTPITRNNLFGVNKGNHARKSKRAIRQKDHRLMLYLAMRISMESGIRIGSLRQMRWSHISANKTLSSEDQKIWCLIEVPAENTKTGRHYELSAPCSRHLEHLKCLTKGKSDELLFINLSTRKALSDRIWRDGLLEMLVEAGLATWAENDSNNCRKANVKSGKSLSWYSFRHTYITLALERGVPIATVCSNCDTSIQYVQEHYFHYDAKRATEALITGRKRVPKGGFSAEWMKDPYVKED